MPLDDALRALDNEANADINWAVGDLHRERVTQIDWQKSPLLQQLDTGRNIHAWNELFRRTRQALLDESELPQRATALLRPQSSSFDDALDDFIAEMLAVQYLAVLGHTEIRLVPQGEPITADITSSRDGLKYVTEAKNLREPRTLTYTAFARWHHNRARDPDAFNFGIEFLELDDPFEDLTGEQANAVQNLVDTLPNRARPSEFTATLPGDRKLRVRVRAGDAVMLRHGPGPFLVAGVTEECERAMVVKLLDPARKALAQLYAPAVPADYRRLLFVRWKPPDEIIAIGAAEGVRTSVRDSLQAFIRQFFPNFALSILHTYEDVETTPAANW